MIDSPTVTERIARTHPQDGAPSPTSPSPTATQVLLRRALQYAGALSWQDLYQTTRGAAEVAAADQPTSPDQPERN